MTAIDKLERLITLIEVLLSAERPLRLDQIREQVPGYPPADASFRRKFERDKDDLREMGIPIEVVSMPHTNPPQVSYRLRRDAYFLKDPGLDAEELAALHLALELAPLDGAPGDSALWAFGGAVPAVSVDAPLAALPGDGRLAEALDAIAERATLRFDYRSAEGPPRVRTIDPHRIEFQRGHWYLSGRDHDRDALRHFRFDRILSDAFTRGPKAGFGLPADASPVMPSEAWRYGSGPTVAARVRVDAMYAAMARKQVEPGTEAAWLADGSLVLTLAVTNVPGFRAFVAGFFEHAEVLDPPELRADFIAWLEQIAQNEAGDQP